MPQKADWQEIIGGMDISLVTKARASQVKSDVAHWAKRSPELALDPSGSHPEMADRQLALRVSRSEKRTVWSGMVQCEAEGSRS
jgi:hypothetical protein